MAFSCTRSFVLLIVSLATCLYGLNGCLEEERNALLLIKDSMNYPDGSALSDSWVGEDCCKWPGVVCTVPASLSSVARVYQIDLTNRRESRLGSWYPNATMFAQFKELQGLILYEAQIGGWVAIEGFKEMQNLEILDIMNNRLNESMYSLGGLCGLTKLQTLYLENNNLDGAGLPPCLLKNLSSLVNLRLGNNNFAGSLNILTGLCGLEYLYELDLSYSNLGDESLPSCLMSNNTVLGHLDLTGNNLKGTFGTKIGTQGLRNLQELDLSSNQLSDETIATFIYNLSSIIQLSLQQNYLKDSNTLMGFCNLRNLGGLALNNNAIEGSIPPCIGQMHSLVSLDLSHNQLNGSIPPFLFKNLTSLATISISDNQLTGISSFAMFANLSQLIIIDLSNNVQLEVETESPTWIPKFQLLNLYIGNCYLNKHKSGMIPSFISTQYKLNFLYLSFSSLEGPIPSWLLYNNTELGYLLLRGNSLSGQVPQSSKNNMSHIIALDISNNHFCGALQVSFGFLFHSLYYFNASNNNLQGIIPLSLGEILPLQVLDLSNNNFSGMMPAKLANGSSLQYLSLSNNHLHGEMLPGYSNMTQLKYFNLHGNCFTGPISHGLSRSTQLKFIDIGNNCLSGTIPSWLPVLTDLLSLLLGGNLLEGQIPWTLCQLQNMHFLDLSQNNLSGNLPDCLNNNTSWKKQNAAGTDITLTYFQPLVTPILSADFTTKGRLYPYKGIPLSLMTGIDLSLNKFSGPIPSEIGDLKALHSLNLSYNFLRGPFPESFQNAESLESLDLSHNNLVGMIPPEITQLHALSVFSVAYNNLSGRIPFQNQFGTFDESSYRGNPGLCGQPLRKNCSQTMHTPRFQDDGEQGDYLSFMDNKLFYILFVVGSYALGFWGVIAVIFFNNTWRHKYFEGL